MINIIGKKKFQLNHKLKYRNRTHEIIILDIYVESLLIGSGLFGSVQIYSSRFFSVPVLLNREILDSSMYL